METEKKIEKTYSIFFQELQLSNFKKIYIPLNFFEFHEQFLIGAFLINLPHFGKTGSIGKIFISIVSLIKFHSRN